MKSQRYNPSDDGDGSSHLQGKEPEHKMILTGFKNSQNRLRLRCKCMVQYKNVSDRWLAYDWIAEGFNIPFFKETYKVHLATGATRLPDERT